ncbi:uncharacterized protein EV420DRAFT_1505146 [Desarmillaria tabescens]|uniref:START domain-containing protein n=1 Tax=Armillaria tabescens TaxID=1929756 RepID=A0AA39NJE5_ARMTA|nr:uncharacterized protein EV420DRAFT_1505146 [Desarmillaria tabescens]KAK0466749.1 hypothetical protein EV420DRAFT_1505146 [Desarmillaria tabescens]
MSDGSSLRQSWYDALSKAETHFRQLLTSSSPNEWKRLSAANEPSSGRKGKSRMTSTPELADVVIHRNSTKPGDDIYRLILEVPTTEESVSLEPWKTVLSIPELRKEWDPAVVDSHMVEMFDHTARISKTNFTLGWPANPRDAVTISRSFHDATTFIDVSTSLPRSPDEPVYLRPAPPYVRSNVTLFAWCIQHIQPSLPANDSDLVRRRPSLVGRIRVTCFWQHDLRAVWSIGSTSGIVQQLSTMILGLYKTVLKRGMRIPKLIGFGNGVTIERIRFQVDREALTIDYSIIPEEDEHKVTSSSEFSQGLDELHAIREHRRLTRSIECILPASAGWDIRISVKASSEEVERLPWSAHATRTSSHSASTPLDQILFRLSHAPLIDEHSVLRVRVVIEISGPSSGLRLNGIPHTVQEVEERDPSSFTISSQILQDVSSAAGLSFDTTSSLNTSAASATSVASTSSIPVIARPHTERSPAAEKSILSRVKRNYIYFSSLLQEPEAKWKRNTEARGVTITQLDSIDPTLVVYRAEATFVGVGLWDLYGAIVTPGARNYWDKQHEDAVLLEDVNDLTELWHLKTKPAWPVNGRDAVVLKTVYKSPTTIHVFAFSADDPHLFPVIPPAEPNVIRTQVDLQGWAIEALSPTTTLVTLLEQSDPKGWTNKTSIPTQMMNALAGIGEFTIKCGGPPVMTRLAGAKANEIRYDHERMNFRIEYEVSASRSNDTSGDTASNSLSLQTLSIIECELRCDMDTWASSLDIVIDPPPQSISCLRRHRLSEEGGGLWLTIIHDAVFVDDERLLAIVRRGPGKEKGVVMVNGAKVNVDVEEIPEQEIKFLSKRKRVKPVRIPLDQPPVVGVIRKRRAEWDADSEGVSAPTESSTSTTSATSSGWPSAPQISSPLVRFFTFSSDQTSSSAPQSASSVISTADLSSIPSATKSPIQYALDALAWTQETHSCINSQAWIPVSDKGMTIRRKISPEISPSIPIHMGEKVIEGVSAEELASIVTEYDCRKKWDERFDSAIMLESYGADCRTCFVVSKSAFPFRDRGMYLASVMARAHASPSLSRSDTGDVAEQSSSSSRSAIYCVSVSFSPESVSSFSAGKYNPYILPVGRVFIDAWILETLDPYTKENYAVPSSRCTRLVAVDYAGSIPTAVNSMINAALPRAILGVEAFVKSISPLPITRLPAPGFVLADKKDEAQVGDLSWKLRRRDDIRTLVKTSYKHDTRVYASTILISFPSSLPPTGTRSSRSPDTHSTPRSSRLPPNDGIPPSISETLQSSASTISGLPPSSSASSSPLTPMTSPSESPTSHQRSVSDTSFSGEFSLRGRSSSAFTVKGEVRQTTDLLVGELVVDSKLYPDGYTVVLTSRARERGLQGQPGLIDLQLPEGAKRCILPLAYTIHTVPLSPLHSSGMNAGSPTRHLLRLTLPTAQYQISTVKDPLTGETQSAPPKPQWLIDMEECGAIVDVEVRPLAAGKKGVIVLANDSEATVVVVGEKESLTTLGRDELSDDRVSKMGQLSRSTSETEPLPAELLRPIALDFSVLDPASASNLKNDEREDLQEAEERGSSAERSEDGPKAQAADPPATPHAPHTPVGGLLGFLQSYPNPLTRFTANGTSGMPAVTAGGTGGGSDRKLPGGLADIDASTVLTCRREGVPRQYPLSTLIIIALIAFLIGSLLRSLLSPADFIYVVTDLREAEEANNISGWREIRRLFEVKYILAGWDFQIAVVRRH